MIFSRKSISKKSELLYSFNPNKSYGYLLNVEPSNLVSLKTYNTKFDDIKITFTDKNCRQLEVENKVSLILLININRNDTLFYRTKDRKG